MHTKKRSPLLKPTVLLELASHATMGVAVGLTFAFIVTHIPACEVTKLIAISANPREVLLSFVSTSALMFGIGAALTGLVFKVTEDS